MISGLIKNVLRKTGYTMIKTDFLKNHYRPASDPHFRLSGELDPLEQLFYKYLDANFSFIQIGANNGKRYDPINHLIVREKQKIRGIAIEPVSEYFEELKVTYQDFPQIKLIRTAIHNTETESTIYKIDPQMPNIEEHLKGMSSFDINNLTKDGIETKDIISEKVPSISFMQLIEQQNIKDLTLLQIDAEGYDLEIIKSIDFNKIKPRIINFEHRWEYNLIPEIEIFKVLKLLVNNSYKIVLTGNDALAYLE